MSASPTITSSKPEGPAARGEDHAPGRDCKVNPIEEVTVGVEAKDDFGLQDVTCTTP